MPDFNAPFSPALPKPASWSVSKNNFDNDGKNPKRLTVFIPLESVPALAQHLHNLADNPEKIQEGQTYDYKTQSKQKVQGIYLNCTGKTGEYGDFGNINPAKADINIPF